MCVPILSFHTFGRIQRTNLTRRSLTTFTDGRGNKTMKEHVTPAEIDITIEELEAKIAPDGETVLPLPKAGTIRGR
jgi:hypothetical protein